jgi:hypothetical protein
MSLDENSIPVEEEVTREIVRVLRMGAAFQAALHGLHSKLELPAVLDEQERMRLAAAYDATAGTLRARAGAGGKREFFEAALVDTAGCGRRWRGRRVSTSASCKASCEACSDGSVRSSRMLAAFTFCPSPCR